MVLSIPPYALMMTCVGVLRGLGRPRRGAVAVAAAFFGAGLPFGAWYGVARGHGLRGVWAGDLLALALAALLLALQSAALARAEAAGARSLLRAG